MQTVFRVEKQNVSSRGQDGSYEATALISASRNHKCLSDNEKASAHLFLADVSILCCYISIVVSCQMRSGC